MGGLIFLAVPARTAVLSHKHKESHRSDQGVITSGLKDMMLKNSAATQAANRIAHSVPERRYRPELHGVRGLAILGVVLFHLFGAGRVSGGLDIFLTISGFLFTGMLLREVVECRGRVDFARYFGRLFRRIFVPAAIVIITTVAVGLVVFPTPQHGQVWTEALASLLYYENIELIRSHLSYEAASQDVSPFQHFWSLSVQGQFYLVLPFVVLGSYWFAQRFQTSVAKVMAWLLAAVLVASMGYAVYVGSYAQDEAYLMTRTRVWQFAFGGLLALVIDRIQLTQTTRFVMGYIGLASVIAVGFVLDGAQMFPGPWALWPLAGFALILLAAPTNSQESATKGAAPSVLSNRVFAWIGDHAYGLYLWHWPLLVFYLTLRDRDAVGIRGAAIIFAITIVLSMLMHTFVEKPLDRLGKTRRGPRLHWISLSAGATAMAVGVLIALPQIPTDGDRMTGSLTLDTSVHPGALSISDNYPVGEAEFIPGLDQLHRELPPYKFQDCEQEGGQEPGTDTISVCEDPQAPANPTARVVLAAGSHSGHWENTVRSIGEQYGWEVQVVTKSGCPLQNNDTPDRTVCQSWNDNFIEWLHTTDVDLVISSATRIVGQQSNEVIMEGAEDRWHEIRDLGIDLLLIRGTPRPGDDGGRCLQNGGAPQDCGVIAGDAANPNPLEAMELPDGAQTIDMNPYVCENLDQGSDTWCEAVVGNIIVWYDGSHFTPEYASSMAPAFEREMYEVFPQYLN